MSPLKSKTESLSRVEFLTRELEEVLDEDAAKQRAETLVAKEDERIWAWVRDPVSNLTQAEARDRAQVQNYGRHNISQSTVSRKVRKLDERMLVEPSVTLDRKTAITDYGVYQTWKENCSDYLDAWRAHLARQICDQFALRRAEDWNSKTPDWASKRVPGLGDDVTAGLEEVYDDF